MDDEYIINDCRNKRPLKKLFRTSKKLEKEKRAKISPKWFNDRNDYIDEHNSKSNEDEYVFNDQERCLCYYNYYYYVPEVIYIPREECVNYYCRIKYKQRQKIKEEHDDFFETYEGCQTIDECINDVKNLLKQYNDQYSYQSIFRKSIISKKLIYEQYLEKLINMRNSIIFEKFVTEPRRTGHIPNRLKRGNRFTDNMKNIYMPIQEQKLNQDCIKYIIDFL